MNKIKLIVTITLMFVVLFAQAGHAAAAPLAQTSADITGTVTNISFETDANNVTTVLVTLVDDQNVTQTVRISVDTAASLGLLVLDENGQPVIDPVTSLPTAADVTQLTEPITITSDTIIPDTTTGEEPVHPISALLAGFFGEDASIIDGYHTDGFGFGVIAQALWMSKNLGGDASLTGDILQAKQEKDFEAFFESHPEYLVDGQTIPTNWGQFKKAISEKKNNLGSVVSGQADESDSSSAPQGNGNGNGQGNGNGHGNGNNNNGNGHGKGNNKP